MEKTEDEIINNTIVVDLKSQKNDLNFNKTSGSSLHNSDENTKESILFHNRDSGVKTTSDTFLKPNDNHQTGSETQKRFSNELSPDSLPTLHKTMPSILKTTSCDASRNDKLSEFPGFDRTSLPGDRILSKTILTHTSRISPSLYSDSSAEAELNCLTHLKSLKTDQSIYKLAYDESITDQSEADSRSPSPVDPESQVPKSLITDEIIIHEADSCSDAGSEDVELIPHRYESETFLNESKHMYVNKLSLAVELLRTKENLPYDEQFKRVSEESDLNLQGANPDAAGEVNFGFESDSSLFDDSKSHSGNYTAAVSHDGPPVLGLTITGQSQIRSQTDTRSSAAVCSFEIEDSFNESCEEAMEEMVDAAYSQDNSDGVRAGFRRIQVQSRHYFTPKAALVNPCLCCVIM